MIDWVWYNRNMKMKARTMIRGEPVSLERIARETNLSIEEVEAEKQRIDDAWAMVLDEKPEPEIVQTGIEFAEMCSLLAVKRDRKKLFVTAQRNGLTAEEMIKYFEITPHEAEYWKTLKKEEEI